MKSKQLLRESFTNLQTQARRWVPSAYAYVLFQWAQDIFPLFGGAVASVLGAFVVATSFSREWKTKSGSLIALGLLGFPAAVMWSTIASLVANVSWSDPLSKIWALPALIFTNLSLLLLYLGAIRLLRTTQGLDDSLRDSWRAMGRNSRLTFGVAIAFAFLFFASFLSYGLGFLVTAPWAFSALALVANEVFKNENAEAVPSAP